MYIKDVIWFIYTAGYLIVMMMGAYSSVALKIYPPLQHYTGTTEFTSFICSNDDDSYVSGDEIEWLFPNFTIMTSTPDYRIDGIIQKLLSCKYACMNTYLYYSICNFNVFHVYEGLEDIQGICACLPYSLSIHIY